VRSLKLSIEHQIPGILGCREGYPRLRVGGPRALGMWRMIQELSTESQVEKLGIKVTIAWPLCKVL
jgi:hypothetical protein